MTDEFLIKNKELFEQLSFTFKERNKSALAVINTSNSEAEKSVKDYLPEILPNYKYIDIDLTGKRFSSLTNYLKEILPESIFHNTNIEYVINITGLQNLALQMVKNKADEHVFVASKVIEQINFERERIFSEIPAILILYIDNYTITKLQQTANDFWDWINYYFKFESIEEEINNTDFIEDENYKPEPHYTEERKKKIDELTKKLSTLDKSLPEARFFKNQINLQIALARELHEVREFSLAITNLQTALTTIDKYELSLDLKDNILFYLGDNNLRLQNYKKSLNNYQKAIDSFKKTKHLIAIGNAYQQIGIIYTNQKKWNKAFKNLQKAIHWNKKTNRHSDIGNSYHQIGRLYENQRRWNEALENYLKAIDWHKKTNNLSKIGAPYHHIGRLYAKQKKWNEALENYQKAIHWCKKTNNLSEIGNSYNQIGILHIAQKEWNEAFENFQKAIDWNEKTNNIVNFPSTFGNIRLLFSEVSSPQKAIDYYQISLEKAETEEKFTLLAYYYHEIALTHKQLDNKEAFIYFEKALKYKKKYRIEYEIETIYYFLADFYDEADDERKAFEYYTLALEFMLKFANYTFAGLTIQWLKLSLEDCDNEELKQKAIKLLKEAEKRDIYQEY